MADAETGCCCAGKMCGGANAASNCCCGPPIWVAARGVYIYLVIVNGIFGVFTGIAVTIVASADVAGAQANEWWGAFLYASFAVIVIGLFLGVIGGCTVQGGNPAIAMGCWITYCFLIICQLAINGVKLVGGDIVGGIGGLAFIILVDGYCNFIIWSHWQRCKDGTFNNGGGGVTVIVAGQMASTQVPMIPVAVAAASSGVPVVQGIPNEAPSKM